MWIKCQKFEKKGTISIFLLNKIASWIQIRYGVIKRNVSSYNIFKAYIHTLHNIENYSLLTSILTNFLQVLIEHYIKSQSLKKTLMD